MLTLLEEDRDLTVWAVLPGHFRPQLWVGMPARLEITGYPHAYQSLRISTIADEVIGPDEARRFLGPAIADAVPISGPSVLVTARLEQPDFGSGGHRYAYFDGMHVAFEARVESEPIILKLVPGLKMFLEGEDD